ncbi:hypothetical protein P691DRAFT_729118 [Macrolepiota fuliginosa MF-IS2]|uniref:Prolyl 4-hydroxylase alpha subunit domain-containing protein n=1 Tax=Macrolepiota fuliginosa MF-IS2 TaxID=1400762 RepID=A0A9P6C504_9AGAR|nr:hypothetical protein P691DRAFT_729118 [Macrolepiota fuliginosa MF-IS2]
MQSPSDYPVLDFSTTTLPEYSRCYCKVIDDVFSPEDCAALIALAESDNEWEQAAVHYGLGASQNYVDTSYRNSERILRFDHKAAELLFRKLLPYVPELNELKTGTPYSEKIAGVTGLRMHRYKLVGLNERLSFLRYGPGNYFRSHCDGMLQLPDGRKSFVTVQIYLGDEYVQGGATRFWSNNHKRYLDIDPKPGRVLIFQQRELTHSGEDVVQGRKYALRSDLLFVREPLGEEDVDMW